MLEKLITLNSVPIYSVSDNCFNTFGNIIQNYNFEELVSFMENKTQIPSGGNVYIPSVDEMEKTRIYEKIKNNLYGGLDIQIGYCNGRNSTYNGFEYHKGSELNIAITDFCLVLGHVWDIQNNQYCVQKAKVFYVEKGTAIEMYQTTLHLSPCKVQDGGYKNIVVLPRGTNTPLYPKIELKNNEDKLLLMKNKWLLCHPQWEPLIKQYAYPGLKGENIKILY